MANHQKRQGVKTSNRPLADWGKLIGDVPSATAILDRFLHHAEILTIAGRSYRPRGKAAVAIEAAADQSADGAPKPAIPPTGSRRQNRAKAEAPMRRLLLHPLAPLIGFSLALSAVLRRIFARWLRAVQSIHDVDCTCLGPVTADVGSLGRASFVCRALL